MITDSKGQAKRKGRRRKKEVTIVIRRFQNGKQRDIKVVGRGNGTKRNTENVHNIKTNKYIKH